MITFKFLRFPFAVCVPHNVNELVTDIILNITSKEDLMLTLLHIGSRLFELFNKEVRVKKQPGRPLKAVYGWWKISVIRLGIFIHFWYGNILYGGLGQHLKMSMNFTYYSFAYIHLHWNKKVVFVTGLMHMQNIPIH